MNGFFPLEFIVAMGLASGSNKDQQHAITLPRLSFLRVAVFVIHCCHGIKARVVVNDCALTHEWIVLLQVCRSLA